jgi:uncharacterized protein YyaL (SSP411 family)
MTDGPTEAPRNRLAAESSPYLLQHAGNPVDWYPWGDEAIARGRAEDKPILLSIGYSACHWCHVMAHESFEDTATATVMNEHYVNVKVDREERPDIDKIYQLAHQLLTQSTGGWPLTAFLDPHTLVPFFAGTYFPKTPRYQLPGFVDLLLRIATVYREKREELRTQGAKLTEILGALNGAAVAARVTDEALLDAARDQLAQQYDRTNGGFGNAPKFPMPATIERLLRHWAFESRRPRSDRTRNRDTLEMAMITLTHIARGGIFDHLGGGFCRYATDARWMIPHFEKMLYDNGALLSVYADALAVGPDLLFEGAVRETAQWLMRDMQHPAGGYFSALDADSEGEEGRYYVWRRDEVKRLLDAEEYLVVETLYGLDKPANFEGRHHLHRYDAWASVVERLGLARDRADALLASAKGKLKAVRDTRVAPALDDKVLTAWNGLAIKGMVKAGVVCREPAWIESATRALDFIAQELCDAEGLYATWRDGVRRYRGYLDDYAHVLDALVTALGARWRDSDVRLARRLADLALDRFEDKGQGGFFFTAAGDAPLIHRPKPTLDEATPAGNGVLARALHTLGHLFGESRYIDAAVACLRWARGAMERYPAGHCALLSALEDTVYPPELVVVRGPADAIAPWVDVVRQGFKPWRHVYGIPYEGVATAPAFLPKLVSGETRARPTAYVCTGQSCSLPIVSLDALKQALERAA